MKLFRPLIKLLRVKGLDSTSDIIRSQKKSFIVTAHLLRLYYILGLYFIAQYLREFGKWMNLEAISPLWPVVWVNITGIETGVYLIALIFLIFTTLASISPHKRLLRILYFIGILQFVALQYSFGKIGHSWHVWLAAGFMFIFLPDGKTEDIKKNISKRHTYLTAFWGSQALVMFFYSLSGFWKVFYGIIQFLNGEVGSFSPYALSYHVANRLNQTNISSLGGNFIIEHPHLSWPLYLGVIYLELFSIVAVFRPSVHRIWGLLLIFFHFGSYIGLTIIFKQSILLLAFLFACSPFSYFEGRLKENINDLPLIGSFVLIFKRLMRENFI